uniref:Cadherin domain-containing protein n=1 Tax=Sinocyclocheilus grahami TaxID=75366 RepID=A0A672S1V2_SINGR
VRILLWWALWLLCFAVLWSDTEAQLRYTIPEELKEESIVGNVAKDLGLDLSEISNRKLRIASESGKQYFSLNLRNGELLVNDIIDRETLCGQSSSCVLPVQVIIEDPLQFYRVDVDIQDINDNSPIFLSEVNTIEVPESTLAGARFRLEPAQDPDAGTNSLRTYALNKNEHFVMNIKTDKDGTKVPEIILEKAVDREKQSVYHLTLTGIDGGDPARSGTTRISVKVLDANDNAPVFEHELYELKVMESTVPGTMILTVKAVDLDDGVNGEVEYSFAAHTPDLIQNWFAINPVTGELIVSKHLDYETSNSYKIDIRARDKGSLAMEGHCRIQVNVLDVNDNAPEIIITSSPKPVPEDAPAGTMVALINVKDLDSGVNGNVTLSMSPGTSFKLKSTFSNHYALVTDSQLDREKFPRYNIELKASDSGSPPLVSSKLITPISDYTMKTTENNNKKKSGKIALYLIISLGTVSVLSVLTLFTLIVKCVRSSIGSSSCCIWRTNSEYKKPNRNLQIQLNTDGPIKYVEVLGGDMMSQSQSFGSYLSPMSEFSDLTLVKPSSTTNFTDTLNVLDASLPDSAWTFESQQVTSICFYAASPNTVCTNTGLQFCSIVFLNILFICICF